MICPYIPPCLVVWVRLLYCELNHETYLEARLFIGFEVVSRVTALANAAYQMAAFLCTCV